METLRDKIEKVSLITGYAAAALAGITEILPDRKWIHLSDNIKVFCITTVIQDAILLIDVNGYLFVNLNDAGSTGATRLIRKIARKYRKKFD